MAIPTASVNSVSYSADHFHSGKSKSFYSIRKSHQPSSVVLVAAGVRHDISGMGQSRPSGGSVRRSCAPDLR